MSKYPGVSSIGFNESLIFDRSRDGRSAASLPGLDVPAVDVASVLPESLLRTDAAQLPELSEPEVTRHFTRLSTWNFSVDHGFYPLGSCTMKYNPKVNEWAARLEGFAALHPYTPVDLSQGAIQLMVELEAALCEISGMHAVSLQPAAGAHGELTAMMAVRAALTKRGNPRKKVLIPDTAHGTNPATVTLNGYVTESVASSEDGYLSADAVRKKMNGDVAALMLTNPNTLGLFEKNITEICKIVHEQGGFVFGDGANLNAIMGKARPGDYGIDAMQFNLHKTFSTPHGGGGPGSGPVGVCAELAPFLPGPRPVRNDDGTFDLITPSESIGRVRSFYGNFGVMVKAYAYIRELGARGLTQVSETAVLNANYLLKLIADVYHIPYGNGKCMHEVVASDKHLAPTGVSTLDVAKGLVDRGFHPPTVYFPLVVKGALMCEPTETESKDTIEEFANALLEIAEQARIDPDALHRAPVNTRISRLDEATAARKPILVAPIEANGTAVND
ncbi:MAG: aminomethyl-transferring glycine dehydrogenase subunit GcvPB [Deltaproteobacteria bacterium]|nr:aminomethyl-transferring glycine dehydrogenase subunit GcvPB [Deltaproteobacteria bacterium]